MELDPSEMTPAINRIKGVRGQLDGVVRMLEEGRDCEDVVTQLAAVFKGARQGGLRDRRQRPAAVPERRRRR